MAKGKKQAAKTKADQKGRELNDPCEEVKEKKEDLESLKDALEGRLKDLEQENGSLKDQFLRKQADFENFRKRMFREKEEAIKYANSQLLLDTLTLLDDFDRAIRSSEDVKDYDSLYSGVIMIEKQFLNTLERGYGLKRFESLNCEFDPEMHEAIAMEQSDKFEAQTVVEDFQKGYMLHERVLRHAKVKVTQPITDEKKTQD